MAQWASYNPWNVSSIHEFWSLKCPECVFDSKEEDIFQDHALRNHPLSFLIFGKTLNDVKEEYVDPFFETVEYHDNQDQISIKKELSSEFSSFNTAFPSVNGEKKFSKKQRKRINDEKDSQKIHTCSYCEYSCSKLFDLKMHTAQVHENIAPFECPGCTKSYPDHIQLRSHFKNAHSRIGGNGKGLKFEEKDQNEDPNWEQKEDQNEHLTKNLPENLQLKESNSTEKEIIHAINTIKEENMLDINEIKSENMSLPFHEVENVQDGRKYQCNFCEKRFVNLKHGIQKHITEVHEGKKAVKSEFECPNCDNSFSKECTLKQHVHYVHEGKKLVNCYIYEPETGYNSIMSTVHEEEKRHLCYCYKSYNTLNALKKHVNVDHLKIKRFKCNICQKCFGTKFELNNHVGALHEGKSPLITCSICGKFHKNRKHKKLNIFECSECDINFENKCVLKQHANSAHEDKNLVECYKYSHQRGMVICHMATLNEGETPNKCLDCDKYFTNDYCFKKHVEEVHKGKEKIKVQCSKCDKKLTKNALKVHIKTVHERIYPFLCNTCGYKTIYQAKLKNHIALVHEGKRHICSICGVGVTSPTYLKKHIESVHEGIKRYMCEFCEYRCYEASDIKNHVQKVHDKIRTHQCNICQKFFGTTQELNQHISAVHEGKKPYQCSHCDKKFSARGGLDSHIKGVHEGKKVICPECGASFSISQALRRHIKGVHMKETPYVCKICNHGFKQNGNLKHHMATVHRGIENL